jgi:D-sedoheptulose 7-phosphate isomerase
MRIGQFRYFKDHNKRILDAVALMENALKQGNKILIFGNGGSAAQSAHFAAELVNKFYFERKALPAIALTTDTACITSIANDMDFKYLFSRQLEALGKPGDIAIGLTTSGKSPNVIDALQRAGQLHLKTIALCGEYTGHLDTPGLKVDVITSVPSGDTPLIQELHLFILHTWAELIEQDLFGGER